VKGAATSLTVSFFIEVGQFTATVPAKRYENKRGMMILDNQDAKHCEKVKPQTI
jgi:hypothetical protein